jgi:hypothetical protein
MILIWYVETDNTLVAEVRTKLLGQLAPMRLLHYEYQLGPVEQLWGNWILSLIGEAGRRNLNALPRSEDLLSGGTAETILTANKQNPHHRPFKAQRRSSLGRGFAAFAGASC